LTFTSDWLISNLLQQSTLTSLHYEHTPMTMHMTIISSCQKHTQKRDHKKNPIINFWVKTGTHEPTCRGDMSQYDPTDVGPTCQLVCPRSRHDSPTLPPAICRPTVLALEHTSQQMYIY